ncbi:hypothetical protein GB937_002896 [Aspergillus fischeri]|nr:hypothetical protein GB937_002896 [Aspergillus fischeri]
MTEMVNGHAWNLQRLPACAGLQIRALGILVVAPRPHGGVLDAPNAPHGRDGATINLQIGGLGLSQGDFYLWGGK